MLRMSKGSVMKMLIKFPNSGTTYERNSLSLLQYNGVNTILT